MKKVRVTAILTACVLLCASAYAQKTPDADENITDTVPASEEIPLDQDLSGAAAETASGSGNASGIRQGIWIEATSDNTSIIRDIATGRKKGYELDSSLFKSFANWWFWGDITPSFHLDAEIAVWDFEKYMYKSNSYAANVPDVTWGDGIQNVLASVFAPVVGFNDSTPGTFNKIGFNIATPYVQMRIGYGDLKKNGMSQFTGIYNVLDRWLDVGNGYLEVLNGKDFQQFGKFKVNTLLALSRMRGNYGTYDILTTSYDDKYTAAVTFGSTTTASELFRYNEQNDNALSAYFSAAPVDLFKIELHGLTYFGTQQKMDLNAGAAAARVTFNLNKYTFKAAESFAGENVQSVWGQDGDGSTNNTGKIMTPDTSTTMVSQQYAFSSAFAIGLDTDFIMHDAFSSDGKTTDLYDGKWILRNEPTVDFSLASLIDKDITLGAYGVINVNRSAETTHAWSVGFEEAGIEITANDIAGWLKKITVDYALDYSSWALESGTGINTYFHSLMVAAKLTDKWSLTLAGLYRATETENDRAIPFGAAAGAIYQTSLPGKPRVWTHFTYGMNPYEDTNYELYRYDTYQNEMIHRTYLVNCWNDGLADGINKSHVSFGLIWDIK
jgi:hypothetical protein